ncbi:MAG: hypothetical protein AAGI07_18270 [Bacteroidota bacterium]
MRMITPIAYLKALKEAVFQQALAANFHATLDIKYAISEEIMWSVFIHLLKELSENKVKDAVKQVYYGAKTFEGTYSSTDQFLSSKE